MMIKDNLNNSSKIFVILVNWNGYADVKRCVHSLLTSTYGVNIVLVDNCSTERNIEKVREDYPHVHFIQNDSNAGFGKGNNIGITYALKQGAEYIYILNTDTTVSVDCIEILYNFMEKYRNSVAVSPLILYGHDNKLIWYGGGKFSWKKAGSLSYRRNKKLEFQNFKTYERVQFLTGCSMFIRASVLSQVGSFDEKFFMYVEDIDLSIRLSEAGPMFLIPDAVIYHYAHSTSKRGSEKSFNNIDSALNPSLCSYARHMIEGNFYLVKKHNPKLADKIAFYFYLYSRWIKKALLYLINKRYDASSTIAKQLIKF